MKTECPFCGQHYEVDEQSLNQVASCSTCGKEFVIQPRSNVSSAQTSNWKNNSSQANVKQGALIGAGICLFIAILLHLASSYLFLLYAPLYLAAFILSIIALAQKRILGGILCLIFSIVSPILITGINFARFVEEHVKITQSVETSEESTTTKTHDAPRRTNRQSSKQKRIKEPELPGLCGVMFGDKFDVSTTKPAGELTSGVPYYAIALEKYFMEFKDVSVLVTPKTNLIYAVWLRKTFNSKSIAEAEIEKIKAVLEKHYNCEATEEQLAFNKTYVFEFNNALITLRVGGAFSSGQVEIIAMDVKLNQQAEQEEKAIAIEKTDTSVL